MASVTGIPANPPTHPEDADREIERQDSGLPEEEPLLGRPGAACQKESEPLWHNLYIGTAPLAQAGALLLLVLIYSAVLLSPLTSTLFAAHPLLNSSALLLLTQSILLLQPTHTTPQKHTGTLAHLSLNIAAISALIAALVVIEVNKFRHSAPHFTSAHGRLGVVTYGLLFVQSLIGLTQYLTPSLYGGVEKAKSVYKYHRLSGYVILVLMLATVAAATQTDTGGRILGLKLWSVLLAGALVLIGILPRVRLAKFGYLMSWARREREGAVRLE